MCRRVGLLCGFVAVVVAVVDVVKRPRPGRWVDGHVGVYSQRRGWFKLVVVWLLF